MLRRIPMCLLMSSSPTKDLSVLSMSSSITRGSNTSMVMSTTNSIESFWSLLKRGYYGVYHYMSPKHLKRYIHEFSYRHNTSKVEVMECIGDTITKMIGKRIMYCELVKSF